MIDGEVGSGESAAFHIDSSARIHRVAINCTIASKGAVLDGQDSAFVRYANSTIVLADASNGAAVHDCLGALTNEQGDTTGDVCGLIHHNGTCAGAINASRCAVDSAIDNDVASDADDANMLGRLDSSISGDGDVSVAVAIHGPASGLDGAVLNGDISIHIQGTSGRSDLLAAQVQDDCGVGFDRTRKRRVGQQGHGVASLCCSDCLSQSSVFHLPYLCNIRGFILEGNESIVRFFRSRCTLILRRCNYRRSRILSFFSISCCFADRRKRQRQRETQKHVKRLPSESSLLFNNLTLRHSRSFHLTALKQMVIDKLSLYNPHPSPSSLVQLFFKIGAKTERMLISCFPTQRSISCMEGARSATLSTIFARCQMRPSIEMNVCAPRPLRTDEFRAQ